MHLKVTIQALHNYLTKRNKIEGWWTLEPKQTPGGAKLPVTYGYSRHKSLNRVGNIGTV